MKYKVGDKIRIKKRGCFHNDFNKALNNLIPKRVVTIKKNIGRDYWVEEITWRIEEPQIESLVFEPIDSRFEILDL